VYSVDIPFHRTLPGGEWSSGRDGGYTTRVGAKKEGFVIRPIISPSSEMGILVRQTQDFLQSRAAESYVTYRQFWPHPSQLIEPLPVLVRDEERPHHLGLYVVAVELVELREPEVEATCVRVAARTSRGW
jgi:hypothetical protein